jgi:hypothetical protein
MHRINLADLRTEGLQKVPKGPSLDFMTPHPSPLGDGTLVNVGVAVSLRLFKPLDWSMSVVL